MVIVPIDTSCKLRYNQMPESANYQTGHFFIAKGLGG